MTDEYLIRPIEEAYHQPVSILEETEDETSEAEMERDFEECVELLYDLDAPTRRKKMRTNKCFHHYHALYIDFVHEKMRGQKRDKT
jgi:hypothetical protein